MEFNSGFKGLTNICPVTLQLVLNVDRAVANIFQLPKSCMELRIYICLCIDPTNSGNVLQDFTFTVSISLANNVENGPNILVPRKCTR